MDQNKELYRQLIKEKSEANLRFIGKVLEGHLADRFDRIAEGTEDVEVPKSLDAKFAAMLEEEERKWKKAQRKKKLLRRGRICACLLAVLLVGSALIWNVEAFREKVYEIFYEEKTDYIDFKQIEIPYDSNAVIPADWDGFWYPNQLPDGFILANFTRNDQAIDLIFKNKKNELVFFSQVPTEEMHLLVDNEDQNPEEIEINSGTAFWTSIEGSNLLMWNRGEAFFLLSSGLSKEDMIIIAENIAYLKKEK